MAEAETISQCPVIPDKKCDLCDKNDIMWKCLNCNDLMCDQCKFSHLRSRVSNDYKVVNLNGANVRPSEEIGKCSEHVTENVLMFCKSCDLPVCRRCITSRSHDSHSIELMEDIIDDKKKELLDITKQSKEKLRKYEEILKCIGKRQQEFSHKTSQKMEEVKTRNRELKEGLDKIAYDILRQLQQLEKQNKGDKDKLEHQLQVEITELKQIIQQCEEKQTQRSVNMGQFVTEIKHKVCRYTPTDHPDTEDPPDFLTRNVRRELKSLFGDLVKSSSKGSHQVSSEKQSNDQTGSVPTPKINPVVVGSFPAKSYSRVTVADNGGQAWIWKRSSRNLSLVTSNGQSVKEIKTDFKVFDVLVAKSGELFVTESCLLLRGTVKKLVEDGKFADIYSTIGYKTFGIAETDNRNVIVGLSSLVDGKLVEMKTDGTEIRTMKYDTVDMNTKLFDYPYSVSTNMNGDFVVVDDYMKVVVDIDQNGRRKFEYDGKAGNLTKPFHPRFVVTDKLGNIFISDFENSAVHMLDRDGGFMELLISEKNGCNQPFGISIDTSGRLWVMNKGCDSVMIIQYM